MSIARLDQIGDRKRAVSGRKAVEGCERSRRVDGEDRAVIKGPSHASGAVEAAISSPGADRRTGWRHRRL